MIARINRDTGDLIALKESESKDFSVLADFFASCTMPIWTEESRKAQSDAEGELSLDGSEEVL